MEAVSERGTWCASPRLALSLGWPSRARLSSSERNKVGEGVLNSTACNTTTQYSALQLELPATLLPSIQHYIRDLAACPQPTSAAARTHVLLQ